MTNNEACEKLLAEIERVRGCGCCAEYYELDKVKEAIAGVQRAAITNYVGHKPGTTGKAPGRVP